MILKSPFICVSLFVFLIFAGCNTSQKLANLEEVKVDVILDHLSKRQLDYQYFSCNARLKIDGEDVKIGGRSNIIMVRDSAVMMTFKKIGIEGARALVRPDSSWILYRQENLYETFDTEDFLFKNRIFASFKDVQNLIIGNVPIPDVSQIRRFETKEYHQIEFNSEGISYKYFINEDFSIYKIVIKDNFGRTMLVEMQDYNETMFATKKEIELVIPGEQTSKVSMKLSKVQFGKRKKIRFEVPDHYTHIN